VSRWRTFTGVRALAWVVPLLLVAANLFWLTAFGSGSRVRLRELDRRLEAAQRRGADVAKRLETRERLWIEATENRDRIGAIYAQRFATERSRFTEQVRELKSLAERAGLDPASFAYPEDQLSSYGLVRRSFVFSVNGSYAALRNFLHLLELTDSFLIVEQVGVSESRGGLAVKLRLSTYFQGVRNDAAAAVIDPRVASREVGSGTGGAGGASDAESPFQGAADDGATEQLEAAEEDLGLVEEDDGENDVDSENDGGGDGGRP
jgi:hypothetical protein